MNLPIGRCFPSGLTDVKLLILAQFCSLYERLLNMVENPYNSSKLGLSSFRGGGEGEFEAKQGEI